MACIIGPPGIYKNDVCLSNLQARFANDHQWVCFIDISGEGKRPERRTLLYKILVCQVLDVLSAMSLAYLKKSVFGRSGPSPGCPIPIATWMKDFFASYRSIKLAGKCFRCIITNKTCIYAWKMQNKNNTRNGKHIICLENYSQTRNECCCIATPATSWLRQYAVGGTRTELIECRSHIFSSKFQACMTNNCRAKLSREGLSVVRSCSHRTKGIQHLGINTRILTEFYFVNDFFR